MLERLRKEYPLIGAISEGKEVFWINSKLDNVMPAEITTENVSEAEERLVRFAPYIKTAFADTFESGGIIESPLLEIPSMKDCFQLAADKNDSMRLWLKCDNLLPVSGSIKARGGIYEILCFAEELALKSGMLRKGEDYSVLGGSKFRELFSKYSIAVGSTGNLGLSIGIMGAKLGFHVAVHMSADARKWKKDLLRSKGAEVIEYDGDYIKAVEQGRKQAQQNPFCHFVDDENSRTLFLGYATAAARLRKQLVSNKIAVDEKNPLFVYLPCGVGGAPGGVAYGLKLLYGKNVHCFFGEPTQAPCVLLGVMTGLHDAISVQDVGLTGKTIADGLAVGRASKFVGKTVGNLLDGFYTASDLRMQQLTAELFKRENIFIEPSAAAGLHGYSALLKAADYLAGFDREALKNSTHIAWATGGGMVPQQERDSFIRA